MTLNIQFNRDLDIPLYHEVFRRSGRVHIPDILTPDAARAVLESLTHETPWQAHFNDGGKTYDLHRNQISILPDAKKALIVDKLHRNAETSFQYLFLNYSISDAVEQNTNPHVRLNAFLDFVNSAEALDFVKAVTRMDEIRFADCQATLYKPGHFLRAHNDDIEHTGRLVAYTFSFAQDWHADYGGVLQFLDDDGHIDEGYLPKFNSLNLFRIPTIHCVSYVTPFAPCRRYSLTGWFRK